MINADDVTLVNCEIINNQALLGGTAGIRIQSWNSIINHCTVSGNVASGSGTDALSVNNDAHISNSIFSWNSPYALHISASTTVTYSDFFANDQDITNNAPSGFGLLDTVNANGDSCDVYNNIFLNPLFADTSNGDYSLSWANWPVVDATRSPAIDAGDPTDLKDPDSTTADMGAYYFNYTRPLISASDTLLDFGIVDVGQSLNLPFMIRNTGTASLNIDGLSNSKDVFSHNWSPGSSLIPAGDSLEVIVTFIPLDSNLVVDTLLIENDNHPVLIYLSGQGHIVTGIKDMTELPKKFALYPAYPNPFNPNTTIQFDLPKQSLVTLKVYNILGEDVATLFEKQMNAGRHKYVWNANNLASGIYFYRLYTDEFIKVRKIILLR